MNILGGKVRKLKIGNKDGIDFNSCTVLGN